MKGCRKSKVSSFSERKGSELGTGATMVSTPWYVVLNQAPPAIEAKEARLSTRNEL